VAPLKVFFFSECYLRLCNGMYDIGDLRDRERHISNWQVNKHGRNVVDGAVVSLSDFRSELRELTGREDFWEKELLPSVKDIVIEVLRAAEGRLCQRTESFELFGFDLMVDEDLKPWLLEVNLSPGCESRTPFLEGMLDRMAHRMVQVAVLGLEEPDGEEPDWIKICDDSTGKGAASLAAAEAAKRASDLVRPSAADLAIQGMPLRAPKKRRPGGSELPHSSSPRLHGKLEEAGKASPEPRPPPGQPKHGRPIPQIKKTSVHSDDATKSSCQAISEDAENQDPTGEGQDYDDEDFEEDEDEDHQADSSSKSPAARIPQDGEETARAVSFDKSVSENSATVSSQSSPRKGTGFVNVGDIPDTDNEDEEEATQAVAFDKSVKDQSLSSSQSPQQKDEEPTKAVAFDKSAEEKGSASLQISASLQSPQRKGTGFVSMKDIPDTDDEDEEPAKAVAFDKSAEEKGSASLQSPQLKGTGFVNMEDIPDTDDEDEETFEVESPTNLDGNQQLGIAGAEKVHEDDEYADPFEESGTSRSSELSRRK